MEAAAYLDHSSLTGDCNDVRMVLQTAAGLTPGGFVAHPVFYNGAMMRPDVAAAGLRALVEIASTRYVKTIAEIRASLDPIVTAQGDRLRCEAFSACNGVYARLDLLGDSFDAHATLGFGTTNIDINPPLQVALASIQRGAYLHLRVGPNQVAMDMPRGSFIERKVAMPERWIRALAETQSIASAFEHRVTLTPVQWRRFMNELPTSSAGAGSSLWLIPTGGTLRQTSCPVPESIPLAGSARLRSTRRLQHLVELVRIYAPPVRHDTPSAPAAWEFLLPGARLTLMLSPEPYRGFSGEGAVLAALSAATKDDGATLSELLAWDAAIDLAALSEETGYSAERICGGLQVLATTGQVGFDLAEQSYFHRQLPFSEARLERNYPRLEAARTLAAAGCISPCGDQLKVVSGERTYFVRLDVDPPSCTCAFWIKHKDSRGPCKHLLAARLYLG